MAVAQFDPSGALAPDTLRLVHSAAPWSGTAGTGPGFTGVWHTWWTPDANQPGQPASCMEWNGTAFSLGSQQWKGTVAAPAAVDQTEFNVSLWRGAGAAMGWCFGLLAGRGGQE